MCIDDKLVNMWPFVVVAEAGRGRYLMWSLLLRLLQDEDEKVRHVAAQSVDVLTQLGSCRSTCRQADTGM